MERKSIDERPMAMEESEWRYWGIPDFEPTNLHESVYGKSHIAKSRRNVFVESPYGKKPIKKSMEVMSKIDSISAKSLSMERTSADIVIVVNITDKTRRLDCEKLMRRLGENLATAEKFREKYSSLISFCFIFDGRASIDSDVLGYFTELGVLSPGEMDTAVTEKSVGAHLFESLIEMRQEETVSYKFPKMHVVSLVKEIAGGQIDSYWWFFVGICSLLKAKNCVLLEGNQFPDSEFVLHIVRQFETTRADCLVGEVESRRLYSLSQPFIAAQQFDSKISHFMVACSESIFGFINPYPHSYTAFRLDRYDNIKTFFEPIFSSLKSPVYERSILESARTVSAAAAVRWEVLRRAPYISSSGMQVSRSANVISSYADEFYELTMKRGSNWISGLLVLAHTIYDWPSLLGKACLRSPFAFITMFLQLFLQVTGLFVSWFEVSNLYLMFLFGLSAAGVATGLYGFLRLIWLALLAVQLILYLGNDMKKIKFVVLGIAVAYGLLVCFLLGFVGNALVNNGLDYRIGILGLMCFGAIFLIGLIYGQAFVMLFGVVQYSFFFMSFHLMFPIYGLCNSHKVTSGNTKAIAAKIAVLTQKNKQGLLSEEDLQAGLKELDAQQARVKDYVDGLLPAFRSYLLLAWIWTNGIYIGCVFALLDYFEVQSADVILVGLAALFAWLAIRLLFSFWFRLICLVRENWFGSTKQLFRNHASSA